jgi:hypothetical protein
MDTQSRALRAAKGLAEWRASGKTAERKTPFEKLREKPTLKRAITAMCCDCMGWEEGQKMPPKIRDDIKDCTAIQCPLHMFRPWKSSTDNESEEESSNS